MISRHYKSALLLFAALLVNLVSGAAPSQVTSKATLDSTVMIQGGKSRLNVEFTGPLAENASILLVDTMWHDVEISPVDENDNDKVTSLGNGRTSISRTYIVQAFDSGLYTLPPVYCISGPDTFATNQPVLKISPMPLDTANIVFENGEAVDLVINDFTDVMDADYRFFDFLPGWAADYGWWILAAVIWLAAIIFVYFKWLRHGTLPAILTRKPIPPYELAKRDLKALREENLWQKGADKEYYTRLTDILRTYLQGRFGISAKEMTSREIYDALSANEETRKVRQLVQDLLREADFVKFAQNRPAPEENEEAFRWTDSFIESTKPVEAPPSGKPNKPGSTPADNKASQL